MGTQKGRKHIAHASAEKKSTQKVKPQKEMGGIHDLIAMMEPDSEEFLLPTKGLLGYPDRVRIRTMTSREEKKLASITQKNFNRQMNIILKSCVQQPVDFDPRNLTIADRITLITWLRVVTYGPEYIAEVTCPSCKITTLESYDLNELNDVWLPDDFEEPYFVKLDAIPGGVTLKLMRVRDDMAVNQYIFQQRKVKSVPAETEWTVRYAMTIDDIVVDGVEMENLLLKDKILFFENLPGKDTQKIRDFHNRFDHGVDMRVPFECSNCEYETERMMLNVTASFFMPSQVNG